MRTALLILLVLAFAGSAYAVDPAQNRSAVPVGPLDNRDDYVQPAHVYLWTINACSGFGSQLIDDIPDELYCWWITGVDCIVAQWGGYWQDPHGLVVKFFYTECPPVEPPEQEHYFPWAELDKEIIYDDPGWFTAYWVWGPIEPCKHVEYDMSVGFHVDNCWGDGPPYCGITMTNDYDVYGDCEAWWIGAYWGYVGYVSGYFGVPADIAYSLTLVDYPTAIESSSWGQIKSLYR